VPVALMLSCACMLAGREEVGVVMSRSPYQSATAMPLSYPAMCRRPASPAPPPTLRCSSVS
jgi:hypothetical protein